MLAAAGIACADPDTADVVFLHGRIHTEDAHRSVAQALALRGNSILAVGTDQAVSALIGPHTRSVDLGGKVVLPGIIDAHIHPAESAQDLDKCSLGDEPLTPAEIKDPGGALPEAAACGAARYGSKSCRSMRPASRSRSRTSTRCWRSARCCSKARTATPHGRIRPRSRHRTSMRRPRIRPAGASCTMPPAIRPARCATRRPRSRSHAKPSSSLEFEAAQLARAFDAMRAVGITSVQDADADDHDMRDVQAALRYASLEHAGARHVRLEGHEPAPPRC